MELPNKKLLKGISFQELVVGLAKLENAKNAIRIYQFIMMSRFVASA